MTYIVTVSMLMMMQIEMLQLRSDNERMQKLISQNGLKELQPAVAETDVDSLRKKLSIGDPTTFGELLFILERELDRVRGQPNIMYTAEAEGQSGL